MRHVILMRHAKANAAPPAGGGDFDRALSRRGLRQLDELPRMLSACTMPAERILASPAQRTRQTAEGLVARMPGWSCRTEWHPELYLAEAGDLLRLLAAQPASLCSLCIVGHNPGLADLAHRLAASPAPMPTLGAVAIGAEAPDWASFAHTSRHLLWQAVPAC